MIKELSNIKGRYRPYRSFMKVKSLLTIKMKSNNRKLKFRNLM